MALVTQQLYTKPNDLYDYLSTEGVELRLDDHRKGTGQLIQVLVDTARGDATFPVAPLRYPLLRGQDLTFDGGGTTEVVTATLSTTARTGDVVLLVQPLETAILQYATARDSGVNLALAQRLVKACQYGTSRVKLYCCAKYDDSALVTSWSVNRWATALAGQWLCRRCGQPAPTSVQDDAQESLEEMKQVQVGMLLIEDIPPRTSAWPFMSNVTVDPSYDYHRVRVETGESEQTPTQYGQFVDWNEFLCLEF